MQLFIDLNKNPIGNLSLRGKVYLAENVSLMRKVGGVVVVIRITGSGDLNGRSEFGVGVPDLQFFQPKKIFFLKEGELTISYLPRLIITYSTCGIRSGMSSL